MMLVFLVGGLAGVCGRWWSRSASGSDSSSETDKTAELRVEKPGSPSPNGANEAIDFLRKRGCVRRLPFSLNVLTDAGPAEELAPYVRVIPGLTALDFECATDSQLKLAKCLPALMNVRARNGKLTDAGLAAIEDNAEITTLDFSGNAKITGAGAEHLYRLKELRYVKVTGTHFGDAGLEKLKPLKNIASLDLNAAGLTDHGMVNLKSWPNVSYLCLSNCRITDRGLNEIAGLLALEHLQLDSTDVTDAGLASLRRMKQLRSVTFGGTKVTLQGVRALRMLNSRIRITVGDWTEVSALPGAPPWAPLPSKNPVVAPVQAAETQPKPRGGSGTTGPPVAAEEREAIEFLDKHKVYALVAGGHASELFVRAGKIDVAAVAPYVRRLKQVKGIRFSVEYTTDPTLALVKELPGIRRVKAGGMPATAEAGSGGITAEGLANLEDATELDSLELQYNPKLTGGGLKYLRKLKKLWTLDLSYTSVGDDGLENLKGLESLHELDLSHTKVTDRGMVYVGRLTKLESLFLSRDSISDAGLARLSGLRQLHRVTWGTEVTEEGIRKYLPWLYRGRKAVVLPRELGTDKKGAQ
jgi:Leucine-rich repeat (LRR) protein